MWTNSPLTDDDVLRFVREHTRDEQRMPTIREVAHQFGHQSPSSVQRIFGRLVEQRILRRDGARYELAEPHKLQRGLPLLGRIAAGPPTEAIEADDYIDLGDTYAPERHFGLLVKGDSMIDAHIVDGDIAVIRRQETCDDGDIVVAVIDGEATLKRYYRRKNHILLKAENKRMKPITSREVEIRGVLVGLLRRSF